MSPKVEQALELNRQAAEYLKKYSDELALLNLNEDEYSELENELAKMADDWAAAETK